MASTTSRLLRRWWLPLLLVLLLGIFHRPVLRGMGNYLIVQDEAVPVEAIFVLSGNSFDRGREAARLYKRGLAPKVICLGGETNPALELYDIHDLTSLMTQQVVRDAGVPARAIELLPEGTSTYEEFQAITRICQERGWKMVMVVSSLFHTRRIHEFFRLRMHFAGVEMVLRGAAESKFKESEWWKSEAGLLFLNNEYIKLLYYQLRY